MDSTPLCDRYLAEGWYRAKTSVMSTSAPSLGYCGTLYPFWKQDPVPADGVIQTMTACEVGLSDNCEKQYSIDVKNYTTFLVYKLKSLDACNSAYCFELDSDCVNVSVGNVQVSYHNISWKEEDHETIPGLKRYDPFVNLKCSFTPADEEMFYYINWYADNETILTGQIVDKASVENAILSAEHLNSATIKIGVWIHCVVGAIKTENKQPCSSTSSGLFYAGIEILTHTLTIERQGKATVMLRPTIPFASQTIQTPDGVQSTSKLVIRMSFPGNSEAKCKARGDLVDCSKTIDAYTFNEKDKYEDSTNWKKVYTIDVFNSDEENYYLNDHRLVLRLETNSPAGNGAKIFSDIVFPDVHVNIIESKNEWKGKRCSSYADPHQTTFDGYAYECQDTGCITGKTYIFYRNENHLQEVQVRHENCWGRPRCVCAVAARSGQDVFTIDACYKRQYINFPICNDNSLKVIKETDKSYKIIFPTGTSARIWLYNYGSSFWYINVEIYPTIADVGSTSGLCGMLDNDYTNDLKRRNGVQDNVNSYSYWSPPDDFSNSWRLPDGSTEDILSNRESVFDNLAPLSTYFHKLCTCDRGNTYCSYRQYSECKTGIRGKEYHCVLHSSPRRKRDISFLSKYTRNIQQSKNILQREKRQVISENEAIDICQEAFQKSSHYDACLQVVPNFSNESLVNCINDLSMTGNENLTTLHVDTALGQCQAYILLNSTLEKEQPEVTINIVNLCQNNCSNRGICSRGNCTCDYGFGGSDCSFDTLSPPTITRISDDGLCDKSEESCEDITLYGQYFLENMRTTCYMSRRELSETNTVSAQEKYTVNLEERTLYEGYCKLEYATTPSWVTFFTFNISNDGNQFSNSFEVYVYQSKCQIFNNDTGSVNFTLQDGYCFINGSCIQRGEFQSNDSCLQCDPSEDKFGWTLDCERNVSTSTAIVRTSATTISSTEQTIFTSTFSISSTSTAKQTTDSNTIMTSTSTIQPIPLTTPIQHGTSQSFVTLSSENTMGSIMTTERDRNTTNEVQTSSTATSTTRETKSSTSVTNPTTSPSTVTDPTTSPSTVTNPTTSPSTVTNPTTSPSTVTNPTTSPSIVTNPTTSPSTSPTTPAAITTDNFNHCIDSSSWNRCNKIIAIAGYMVKSKCQKNTRGDGHVSTSNLQTDDEVNIYPDNKGVASRMNFQSDNLFQFESKEEMYSRPPSATSMRRDPPTNNLSSIYNQQHLDKLFSVNQ
ncbi:von Willebrand factor D and EGF domain-containing protein-like [Saccostrea echinata]|uniref:von Willebrand factor D and EGF domain-containing protein-like n=1 Tax=Saccostrea echinata TaxID=191078 RepID=UPI002A813670|nr:von Willebrand factor D and EGF domain-containing protein-like [Saccostrea echinata]